MEFKLKSYGHTLRWHELILTTDNCKITEEVNLDNITSESANLFVDCVYAEIDTTWGGKCAGDIIQKLIDLNYLDFDDVVNFVEYTKAQGDHSE